MFASAKQKTMLFEKTNGLGGVRKLQVAFAGETLNFEEMYFTYKTASFRETFDVKRGGTIYKPRVKLEIPRMRQSILDWLGKNLQRRFVLQVEGNNSEIFQVGDQENPLTLKGSFESGSQLKQKSFYSFEFQGEHWQPSQLISGFSEPVGDGDNQNPSTKGTKEFAFDGVGNIGITHNLGYIPHVTVLNDDFEELAGVFVKHSDDRKSITINLPFPQSGLVVYG